MASVASPLEVAIYTPTDSIDAAAAREFTAFDDVDAKETAPDHLLAKDDDYLAVPHNAAGLPSPPSFGAKDQLDRGLRAWLSVVVSFLTTFVVFGNQVSFGVYQKYYLSTDYPDAKPSTVSLIGSLGPAAQFIAGILIGRVVDRTSYRFTIAVGAVTIGGVLFGLGCSLAFFPGVSLPTQWFVERRALAVGIAIVGSGCGGIVFTAMIGALLQRLGSPWTLHFCGFTSLALLGLGDCSRAVASRRKSTGAKIPCPTCRCSETRSSCRCSLRSCASRLGSTFRSSTSLHLSPRWCTSRPRSRRHS
ncbi:hypothetical protein AMAG_07973 [Allomyces macrogynus ATCC 38327]|uniref:Major facilitator superfamily (MFS) profile domain-containing protein n=1 Tax=Allomyces macrogynus (strain ATCC 38327) TaxID=578462 RepID=A0A0L0SK55_ALLM3|nr:hypothetical protein AMAG_07973 [Allomyces macrogynus ATCC 38327]|eukprot:KNE62790.1 hypothetical protein AMAG_07973 [Allomyces macrogynus ATCC 38327]